MKKRLIKILIIAMLAAAILLSLASCDMLPDEIAELLGGKGECEHTNIKWIVDTPPNCKMTGIQHSQCVACGAVLESGVIVEKSEEHTLGEWEIESEATCLASGTRCKKCTVCKRKVESEEIPPSDAHTYRLGACTLCSAEQPESTGLQFTSNGEGGATVSGMGSCTDISLVIPEISPDGKQVVAIASNAFANNKSITSVVIPNSVNTVGDGAFRGTSITHASVPAPVVPAVRLDTLIDLTVTGTGKIPDSAMTSATSLTRVTIKEGVTEIGESAFLSCVQLYSLSMPDSLVTIGNMAFSKCEGLRGKLTLGSGVVTIGDKAFNGANNITGVYIPESVKYIGLGAFVSLYGVYGRNDSSIVDVEFEATTGWFAASNADDASGTPINSALLEDNTTAADAISNSYGEFFIKRY